VSAEISKITKEIQKITKAAPAPAPVPAATATPPKPVIKKRAAKTQVSEVEGLAGAASFSKNNVYTFYLPDVGTYSTMKFWGRQPPAASRRTGENKNGEPGRAPH
jgi:hypothetical protein